MISTKACKTGWTYGLRLTGTKYSLLHQTYSVKLLTTVVENPKKETYSEKYYR